MALAHFCPFMCPLSLIYSQKEVTFPAKVEVNCVRQGKKKIFISVPEESISEMRSVSRNKSFYSSTSMTLFKRCNKPHGF